MSTKLSGDESLNDSINGDQDTEFSKPVGLTGLQNLGNTCYMNAGIQALSNCPQLTGFMMDCGSFIRKPGLAKAYHRLINDMWSSRRPSYVVPAGISQGIKKVCPAFKGYTQHDAQEFLRCLLDQLHEELKEPVIESSPDVSSPTVSRRKRTTSPQGHRHSSDDMTSEEEYETCDSGLSWGQRSIASGSNVHLNGHRQETDSICTSGIFMPSIDSTGTLMQSTECSSGQLPFVTTSSDPNNVQFYVNNKQATKLNHQVDNHSKKKAKNVTYRSVISDVFDGKLLSSVQCLTCDNVSTTKETFQDLSLSIPTRDQLNALRASSRRSDGTSSPTPSEAGRASPPHSHFSSVQSGQQNPDQTVTRGYTGVIWGWIEWLLGWFWGPSITLEDCLSAFFSADELKGDNMYSCEKCKKLRNGVKYSRVLHLPDILCIHLKRFRHDLSYSCKISAQVSFPLHGLDMAPYMAGQEGDEDDGLVSNPTGSSNVPPSKVGANIVIPKPWACRENGEDQASNQVTTYDLVSVICHHGTPSSGHYTAYCLNNYTDTWYEFDDQYVTAVDENQVASCEAYVLFYRKTSDEVCERRYRAVQLIERAPKDYDATIYYISNQWINRFNTFADPGPISNRDFMCQHGKVDPLKASYVRELSMGFSREIWDYLVSTFSGGPPCNDLDALCDQPSCLTTTPSPAHAERINQIQGSKLLSSYYRHIGSNISLDLPHGRALLEATSTISLPATVSSTVNPRRVESTAIVNGNDAHSTTEPMDYRSLNGNFGFDARKDLKRRHEDGTANEAEPLLNSGQTEINHSPLQADESKKRNKMLEKMVSGDDGERVPLIGTNGCRESANGDESDENNF